MLVGFDGQLLSTHVLASASSEARAAGQIWRPTLDALQRWLRCHERLGPASSLRAILEEAAMPLLRALGFAEGLNDLEQSSDSLTATMRAGAHTPVVLVVALWSMHLDQFWRTAIEEAARRRARWCLLFNGTSLRLLDTSGVYSRRFAQFELELALDDELSLHGLWLVASASALADQRTTGSRAGRLVLDSERQRLSVSRSLREGVLAASGCLLRALVAGRPPQDVNVAFDQALTLVYRMVFLLFAEARSLVPLWHPVYRESYSLEALCDEALRQHAIGMWDVLRAVSRLAHAGCRAGDLRVTPFNGRLFAPSRTPLLDRAGLDDEAVRQSVLALSTRRAEDGESLERISYRDLGVEQIGAVYETLLDYIPHIEHGAGTRVVAAAGGSRSSGPSVSLRPGAGIRKATGTFYTPQPFVRFLVRRTLDPLVADATPERILNLKILDPSMGSGAFLVGACAYLAESYEMALIRSDGYRAHDFGPGERASIRRSIAERCLFGVDLNPMAVQLARLSLWLATLAGDRPLTFLDHHFVNGNSLLGAWLTNLRRPPGRHKPARASLPLFEHDAMAGAVLEALPARFTLAQSPNDTPAQVHAKERMLAWLWRDTALSKWKQLADLWCAHWFAAEPGKLAAAFPALAETLLAGTHGLPSRLTRSILEEAARIAAERRFFHWELEFPEVFFDAAGHRKPDAGFDAIIGNPPWDMVRADRGPCSLTPREAAATVRFSRASGAYVAQSDGHANSYHLFLERAVALGHAGARLGMILPFGFASDQTSAPLRHLLFARCAVDAMVGFDNRRAAFPVHRSVRFLLLTATTGPPTEEIHCRFGETNPAVLETEGAAGLSGEAWFPLRLTPALLRTLSGPDVAIPNLRTPLDLAICERAAASFAPLGAASGWSAQFGRELNATEDRRCLQPPGRGLPLVEGWQLSPFTAAIAASRHAVAPGDAAARLGRRHLRPRLAYRDVASPTNRVTLIAAVLPAGCVTTHTLFCLKTEMAPLKQHFLCGLLNSLVVNYLVRLRVGTHVTTAIVGRLPIPTAPEAGARFLEIGRLARVLARKDRPVLKAYLDALVASLYHLTVEELSHVLDTFPLVEAAYRTLVLQRFRERALG